MWNRSKQLRRSSKFFIIYVKAPGWRRALLLPIPLVVVEELLRGLTIIAWLGQWFLQRLLPVAERHLAATRCDRVSPRRMVAVAGEKYAVYIGQLLNEVVLWRIFAAALNVVAVMRRHPPFDLVRVEDDSVHVRVGLF